MKDLFTLKNGLIAIVILYIISYWKKRVVLQLQQMYKLETLP
jgi:hypothetical protein